MTRMSDAIVITSRSEKIKDPFVLRVHEHARQRGVPLELVRILGAIRLVCRNSDVDQYDNDIHTLITEEDTRHIRQFLRQSQFSDAEMNDWFEQAENLGYRATSDGVWHPEDDVTMCERCEDVVLIDEAGAVVTARNGSISNSREQNWCESCRNNHTFYCEQSDQTYSLSNFSCDQTTWGNTICGEWANYNDWYCNDEGEWSEDSPEDEEEDEFGIPDYHGADRNWSCHTATKSLRPFYGFELEVEFDSSVRRKEFYDSEVKCDEWCAERDGSLSDDYGLEIITRPIALDELREPGNLLEKITLALKDYDAGDGGQGYGVHITSNVNRFTYDHQQRIVDLIVDMKPLSEFIARRAQTDYYVYKKDGNKHDAVAPRDNGSFEFRIFRSTVDFAMLMSYVEYLEAAFEWTFDPAREFTGPLAMSLFRRWFLQQPEKFPYLTKRFAPITKEIQICASQSSNQPVQRLPKLGFVPALLQTLTAQGSRTAA